jgi:hypothetical protein
MMFHVKRITTVYLYSILGDHKKDVKPRVYPNRLFEKRRHNTIINNATRVNTMFYVQRKSPNKMMTINGWMTIASYKTKEQARQAWASLINDDMRIISRKQWHIEALG